ncbi:MAG: small ribosomal subunit biogenesis GTPase RsgA [Natronospirillum sp.]|uniref:small ribosomal subunit biogenesis GTPase RsgA n=1 Tax=Natronospirillum sp. TaxID=2812955 RepID=UPI0025F58A45|nr:small ribosomal subunit biogenesis GTPase RsgA [Natronospirillum sp.]MCH8550698.1 small ribosomal subunit biogenesis GTPase RsgA [Natronospirillum sp.]
MAKRNLSRRQLARIRHTQHERQRRSEKRADDIEKALSAGELGEERRGRVHAHYGATLDIEDTGTGDLVRCHQRANLPALVTGDWVTWRPGSGETGIVVAQESRTSLLARPDLRGNMRPVAANIDQMMVVFSCSPATPVALLDRYLVAAALSDIQPVLLLNKSDLLSADDPYQQFLRDYEALGYPTLLLSALEPLDETLVPHLQERTSVFVGQSGVGKSSLINQLLGESISVQTVSEATGKGRHTTTRAELYHMPGGGALIDSPGIREFGLWHIPPEDVVAGFPEFHPWLGQCRFRDCRHLEEPGCALRQAVTEGKVLARRLKSYHTILASLGEANPFQQFAE